MTTRKNYNKPIKATFKFCPICGRPFLSRLVKDIFVYGLVCASDHKFHVPIENVSPKAYGQDLHRCQSSLTGCDAIANEWLTNAGLRGHLNDYAAKTLRIFLELKAKQFNMDNQNEGSKIGIDNFCSLCGISVKRSAVSNDSYLYEISCANGHRARERGFEITYLSGQETEKRTAHRLKLCLDLDYTNLYRFTHSFISNSEWKMKIPLQVCKAFEQYAEEFLREKPCQGLCNANTAQMPHEVSDAGRRERLENGG